MKSSSYKLIKGSAIIFVSLVILRGFGFVKSIIFARLLDPADLGVYGIVFNIYQMMLAIAVFGIPLAITKYIAESAYNVKRTKIIFSTGLMILIIFSLTISAIYFLISPYVATTIYNNIELSYYMGLSAFAILFASFNSLFLAYFQGIQKMKAIALLNIANAGIFLILSYIFLKSFGLAGAFYALILTSVLSSTFAILVLKHLKTDIFEFSINKEIIKNLIIFGLPLFLSSIIILPAYLLGRTWLAIAHGYDQVGYLQVAIAVQAIVLFIPSAFTTTIYPWLSSKSSENRQAFLKKTIPQLIRISTFIVSLIMIVLISVSGYFVIFFYGSIYTSSIALLQWLLLDALLISQIQIYNTYSMSIAKTYLILKLDVIALLLLIPLLFAMVNRYSAIGLVWSLIMVRIIVLLLYQKIISKKLGFTAIESLSAPIFSAITITSIILMYGTFLIQLIYTFVTLLIYIIIYVNLIFNGDDIRLMRTILYTLFSKISRSY